MSPLWAAVCLGSVLPLARIPDLKPLTDFAARHRLPMPPKDAPLVLAHTGVWSGGPDNGIYSPAFLLEQRPDGSIVILRGLDRETLKPSAGFHKGERLWRTFTFPHKDDGRDEYVIHVGHATTLVCAVQLAARGDIATAQGLAKCFAEDRAANENNPLENASLTLARQYVGHLEHRLLQGPANWRDVRAQMEALFDDVPDLHFGRRKALLADLEATLNATPPPSGSVEALLLDWAGRPTGSNYCLLQDWAAVPREPVGTAWLFNGGAGEANASARELVRRGFDAVPALIALLDDRRITAHDAYIGEIDRVGDLAGELLQEIAGISPETEPYTYLPKRRPPAYWRTWWEKTRGMKELYYYSHRVFRTNWVGRIMDVHPAAAQIIAHKFPDRLPGLCEEFSRRASPAAGPAGLADAVAAAPWSKERRVQVLAAFAGREPLDRRLGLLETVARIDVEAGTRLLLPILAAMPRRTEGPYSEYSETVAVWIGVRVPDERVWKECFRIARQASVGLRLEMIDHMIDRMALSPLGKGNRQRLLAFLAVFLDDGAANGSETITVRDFAATKLADLLGLPDEPDPTWDAIRWARLRNEVRRKLAGERLPDLAPER